MLFVLVALLYAGVLFWLRGRWKKAGLFILIFLVVLGALIALLLDWNRTLRWVYEMRHSGSDLGSTRATQPPIRQ
jgi:hypothetical protein